MNIESSYVPTIESRKKGTYDEHKVFHVLTFFYGMLVRVPTINNEPFMKTPKRARGG